jgi:GNAT superfamily N-acetyltransferase
MGARDGTLPGRSVRIGAREDVPAILALLADEESVVDPSSIQVEDRYSAAFEAIERDPRNEVLVIEEAGMVIGCVQCTYSPGLGRGGAERAQLEALRVRADRRGRGRGRQLIEAGIARARARGCKLAQLTSNRRRDDAHRFYSSLGFQATHEGFKLSL